jgi:hypothetical protein
MSELPYLYSESDTPADQPLESGQPADYVAVYVVRGTDSSIAVELSRRFLKFGKIESWYPRFECSVPSELRTPLDSAASDERYFQIWFRGIPSEKGRFGRAGLCIREVRIQSVSRIMEGRVPPYER